MARTARSRSWVTTAAALPIVALAGWASPTLLRSRGLRAGLMPRLAGQGRPGHVALTFDDGPDPRGTPEILDALGELGWQATFFMLGAQVAAHPRVAASVVASGHEIAVHGFTHRNHLLRSPRDVHADIARAYDQVAIATGQRPLWFRPPYGVLTVSSVTAARSVGLRPVLWTAWGRDWLVRSPQQISETVRGGLRAGGTVLLHDSDCTAAATRTWRATAACLPLLAQQIADLGCMVGPLRDHFDIEA